jgi:hypothetical protein
MEKKKDKMLSPSSEKKPWAKAGKWAIPRNPQ